MDYWEKGYLLAVRVLRSESVGSGSGVQVLLLE